MTAMTHERDSLTAAVLDSLCGDDRHEAVRTAAEVCEHGADAGWPGFTYWRDTLAFVSANRREITALVEQIADDLGTDPVALVRSFQCVDDDVPTRAIAQALYCDESRDDQDHDRHHVENALAWFALEHVASMVSED